MPNKLSVAGIIASLRVRLQHGSERQIACHAMQVIVDNGFYGVKA
jgi:hypothetical protein